MDVPRYVFKGKELIFGRLPREAITTLVPEAAYVALESEVKVLRELVKTLHHKHDSSLMSGEDKALLAMLEQEGK